MVSVTSSSGVFFPWSVCPPPDSDSLCCFESEDSEIQICEFIPVTICVLFFFLYSESISGRDALHTVLTSGFVHILLKEQASPAQQFFFFCGVMTPTLLPVRSGLHLTDVGLLCVCNCHCVIVIVIDGQKSEGAVERCRWSGSGRTYREAAEKQTQQQSVFPR